MIYGSWNIRCDRQNFFSFWTSFCPFTSDNPENQNFEKLSKTTGDIIILHMCTLNDNHMMYGSWNMECDRQNFLSFWTIFCPFTPLTAWKIKILKKMKKKPRDILLHMCTINENHTMYGSWDMKHNRQNFLSFWTFFCPFTPLTVWNIKILKKWKQSLEISFYTCVP